MLAASLMTEGNALPVDGSPQHSIPLHKTVKEPPTTKPRRFSNIDMPSIDRIREKVNHAVMPGDHMLVGGNMEHYLAVGESAMRTIYAALLLGNVDQPKSILDFACGSGRVTRWLHAMYPNAEIHASDVRSDGLDFCAKSFGAVAWPSDRDLTSLKAPRSFDLIWSGSLLTHLSEDRCKLLLKKFTEWLNPGGVCVVTTHGRKVVSNMVSRKHKYVPAERIEAILAALAAQGFAYLSYSGQDVGFSVNTVAWLQRTAAELDVRLLSISEAAWDNHQDVLVYQRP